jgi:hypothetical protein
MREYIELGSAPADENCIQITSKEDYIPAMREECRRYKQLLEQKFTNRPEEVYFTIKRFSHDFGEYMEVCIVYNDEVEEQIDYAYYVEGNLPLTWEG